VRPKDELGKWCEVVVDRSNNDVLRDAVLSVLLVDGNPASREHVREALGAQCVVRFASGMGEALAALQTQLPDLLVSEVDLADGSGLQLCEAIRATPTLKRLPIMLLTDRASINDKVAGFQAGADDYVVKPVDARLFHARVRLLDRIKRIEKHDLLGA
jgi:DNA-binding response OmpR family regulator